MINGNVNEFVEHIYYGDELVFIYDNKKFFFQGWYEDGINILTLDMFEPSSDDYIWIMKDKNKKKLAEEFLKAKVFNGKSFWEIEKEITWVDF